MACTWPTMDPRAAWACLSRKRSSSPMATTARLSKAASCSIRPVAAVPSFGRLSPACNSAATGGGGPVIRPPVSSVQLSGVALGSTLTLNLGQSVTLTATPTSPTGGALTDRPVSWRTTNSRVVTITATGNGTAVVKAVGGGAPSLTAASEGVASPKLNVIVISPCCQVGEGAPPVVQQSFKDALTRNKISVQPPIPSPAERVGNGYIQMVQSADGAAATYILAES